MGRIDVVQVPVPCRLHGRPDPAEAFYKSDARSIHFRLEALSRIGRGMLDKKAFDPLYDRFKQLEDILGAMDHAEAMLEHLGGIKGLAKFAAARYGKTYKQELKQLALILEQDGWWSGEALRQVRCRPAPAAPEVEHAHARPQIELATFPRAL